MQGAKTLRDVSLAVGSGFSPYLSTVLPLLVCFSFCDFYFLKTSFPYEGKWPLWQNMERERGIAHR